MKKLFSVLSSCLLLASHGQGATLTVSNYNEAGTGIHGIADSTGTRVASGGGFGLIGRFTISDAEVKNKALAADITGLNAAFQTFDPAGTAFTLDSWGQPGAFETAISADTKATTRPGFGGSAVYLWLFKGQSRTTATEYLLVRLSKEFPTDAEQAPPAQADISLNPTTVAELVAGSSGPQTFDYANGLTAGQLALYKMISTTTQVNVAPIASNGTLDAYSGKAKSGVLVASDANSNTTLTYSKVANPTKGTVTVNPNGTFTYTANAGQLGADSFTFIANDGALDSNIATVSITISDPPPNTAPIANAATFTIGAADAFSASVTGTDGEGDPLTFIKVSDPAQAASFTFLSSGAFTYRPAAGFSGVDTFTFKVADDSSAESGVATVTFVVEQGSAAWTWIGGDSLPKQRGIYTGGTLKSGARTEAASTSDNKGISYHFGGSGFGEGTKTGLLNDLWKYDANTGTWSWLSGSKEVAAVGTYGIKGQANAANVPGARSGSLLWLDGAGDLWLFGGAASATAFYNDLWKYDVSEGQWTWISGNSTTNGVGAYGTAGLAAAGNTPGARAGAVGLTDPSGNLIVFGGRGMPETGTKVGLLNDLWSYNVTSGQWTWLKGGKTIDAVGVYGVKGTAGSAQTPGGRMFASGWIGNEGMLWVFGGNGRGTATAAGNLNDLWKYNVLSNEWTWVTGASTVNAVGVYGTQGQTAATNTPGARAGAATFVAADGSLLLFGGQGAGYFNDVWQLNQETSLWTWIKGPSTTNGAAFYGSLNESSPSSTPGSRRGSALFADAGGDLLVFGGANAANTNNDVWHLELPNLPVVKLLPITGITGTAASVAVEINPNGTATTAVLKLIKLTGTEEEEEITLTSPGAGNAPVSISQALSELAEGSRYAVQVEAENAFGSADSQILVFTTTGATPAITAGFESDATTVSESVGTVSVVVKLSAPATEAFDLPFSLTGTAANGATGDYTASASPLKFVAGQSQASISLTILDDLALDPNETIIIGLETPVSGGVTLGVQDDHTVTIQDNDSMTLASQLVRLGSSVTFQSPIVGTGITYQWKKITTVGTKTTTANVAKATLPTFTLASVKTTDAAAYFVSTKNSRNEPLDSEVAYLTVVDTSSKTVVQAPGSTLNLFIPFTRGGENAPLLTFAWYKDGVLIQEGSSPTFSVQSLASSNAGNYTVQVSDGVNSLTTGIISVGVTDNAPSVFPVSLSGTYVGLLEVDEDAAPLGGRVDLTVTTKGAYTAKLTQGTVALTAKGQLSIVSGTQATATASFVRSGLPNLTLQFSVQEASTALSGVLADPFNDSTTEAQGYRNQWVAKPKANTAEQAATAYVGDYTFGLELPAQAIGQAAIPQGQGFGAVTVTAGGTATYTGRTADGGKFTVATILSPTGDLPFYAGFTLTQGYLSGFNTIISNGANSSLDGSLFWKKVAADAKSKELAYRAGFDELELTALGGKWRAPAAGKVIADLEDIEGVTITATNAKANANANLVLSEGGPEIAGVDPFGFCIINQKTAVAQTVVLPKAATADNPNSVTFKLIAKPVGHYSGTFVLPNTVKTLVRTVTYQGTFVHLSDDSFISVGFFLLPQLPEPGQTIKTSPQLSGEAYIEAPPVP